MISVWCSGSVDRPAARSPLKREAGRAPPVDILPAAPAPASSARQRCRCRWPSPGRAASATLSRPGRPGAAVVQPAAPCIQKALTGAGPAPADAVGVERICSSLCRRRRGAALTFCAPGAVARNRGRSERSAQRPAPTGHAVRPRQPAGAGRRAMPSAEPGADDGQQRARCVSPAPARLVVQRDVSRFMPIC